MEDEKIDVKATFKKAEIKNEEFSDLLNKINYASNETKKLWKEVYENAVDDRSHAYLLFADLYRYVVNSEKGHADHGRQMAIYLERMNKANDQLLKLAELIENAASDNEAIDAEAVYDSLTR